MTEKWIDNEGNELIPILCEECKTILGFINEADISEWNIPIWCDDCADVELTVNEKED